MTTEISMIKSDVFPPTLAQCNAKELTQILDEALRIALLFEAEVEHSRLLLLSEWAQKMVTRTSFHAVVLIPYIGVFFSPARPAAKRQREIESEIGMSQDEIFEECHKRVAPRKAVAGDGGYSKKKWDELVEVFTREAETLTFIRAEELNGTVLVTHIPPDYRYSLALKTMLRFVRNMMASSWKECAMMYEEQIHRWTLEANSAENLELQRQAAYYTQKASGSATAAAIFSGLNFFFK